MAAFICAALAALLFSVFAAGKQHTVVVSVSSLSAFSILLILLVTGAAIRLFHGTVSDDQSDEELPTECLSCGGAIPPNAKQCVSCGWSFEEQLCPTSDGKVPDVSESQKKRFPLPIMIGLASVSLGLLGVPVGAKLNSELLMAVATFLVAASVPSFVIGIWFPRNR